MFFMKKKILLKTHLKLINDFWLFLLFSSLALSFSLRDSRHTFKGTVCLCMYVCRAHLSLPVY